MENFILKKLFAIGLIAAAGLVSGEVKDHWFFGEDYDEPQPREIERLEKLKK